MNLQLDAFHGMLNKWLITSDRLTQVMVQYNGTLLGL